MIKIIFLFIIIITSSNLLGQSSFQIGKTLRVLSDKGRKSTARREFEAIGNVVLISGDLTLYGDYALINFKNKSLSVKKNLRLNSPEFSILGDEIFLKFDEGTFNLTKSVVKNKQYNVFGDYIKRVSNGDVIIKNGTYSTCKDCDGNWSFKGEKIVVTPGEYVKIKNAYFLANNSPIFYFPYMIFPIKNRRESGFLIPQFSLSANDGVYFQLPYFFAPATNFDMTIAPGVFGGFGPGSSLESRLYLSENDFLILDSYYFAKNRQEEKGSVFYEQFNFNYSFGDTTRFFLESNMFNDYDLYRTFYQFIESNVNGPDIGNSGFMEHTNKYFQASVFMSDRENLITENTEEKDLDYIQIKPDVSFNFSPYIYYPFDGSLSNLSLGYKLRYSNFVQLSNQNKDENKNLQRFDHELKNSINFFGDKIGRVSLHNFFELQNYRNAGGKELNKVSLLSNLNYQIKLRKKLLDIKKTEVKKLRPDDQTFSFLRDSSLKLSSLPKYGEEGENKKSLLEVKNKSIIHDINFNIDYYNSRLRKFWGDTALSNNFFDESLGPKNANLIDYRDSFIGHRDGVNNYYMNTGFSKINTLMISLNNNLIASTQKKSGEVRESSIASIRVDQGVMIDQGDDILDKLTRLAVRFDSQYKGYFIQISEFYFYQDKKSIASFGLGKSFDNFSFSSSLFYDSKTTPVSKILRTSGYLSITPEFKLKGSYEYDVEQEFVSSSNLTIRYAPINDCWFLDFDWNKNLVEQRYFFNFVLNYNQDQFEKLKVF